MRAVTVQFDYKNSAYSLLLDVLIASWRENATIPLEVIRINPPQVRTRHWSFDANTRKLEVWAENFNQDTIFIDADMLLQECISDGFDHIKDVGICDREGHIPINGGVIFVKYTKRGKQFMRDFKRINQKMYEDRGFHGKYLGKYAGMNQSAIGYLLEEGGYATKRNGQVEFLEDDIDLLPNTYNLTEPWTGWEDAKMIHIKGKLRRVCLQDRDHEPNLPHLLDIKRQWKQYLPEMEEV